MQERDWLIIKSLYENKNITKTAAKLYISQPALTARIKCIESYLNVQLIYRNNKGIAFTPAGDYVAKYAEEHILAFNKLKEELGNMEKEIKGVLKIAAPNFVNYRLVKLLGHFKDLYPQVDINLITAQSSDVVSLMHSQSLHFGFVLNDFGWSEAEKILVAKDSLCIAYKQPFELADLPNMVRIDYVMDSYHRVFLDKWWTDNFEQPPKVGILVSSLDVCKEMINSGLGYAIVPNMAMEENQDLYKLKLCNPSGELILRETWLLFRKEMQRLSLIKCFMDFMQQVRL